MSGQALAVFEAHARYPLPKLKPGPVEYNPHISIEIIDIIVTDECERSTYNL